MGRKATQIIEDQFKTWRLQNRKSKHTSVPDKQYYPIVTVSREFGARGAALANVLSTRIGFKVWDKELLQAIAKELGSSERFLETVDEKRRKPVEDAVLGFMKNLNTNVNYLLSLIRVVKTIEKFGSSIIVGRGARYICEKKSSFHIRVVCPLKTRISEYANREHLSNAEANEKIMEKDTERADFIQYSFNKDVNNASDYDLVLNSGTYTLDQMADIVLKAYETKIGYAVTTATTQELPSSRTALGE